MKFLIFIGFFLGLQTSQATENVSLWEYGVGFGYIQFEQYPASDQSNFLFLPFPTFQYRGRIVRADDREGTRAYLLKGLNYSIELSGGGHTSLESSNNTAREGMPDLPWMISLGPQLVGHLQPDIEMRFKIFQTTSTDFQYTKFNGGITEAQIIFRHLGELAGFSTTARISFSAKAATKDYLATYFEVDPQYSNTQRPTYASRAGFFEFEISYFQSVRIAKASYYVGASVHDYSLSVNRESPLHKINYTSSVLVGMTYTLGQSKRDSVPEEETEGILKRP